MATVTIGGKGSSLTPASVHAIAASVSKVKIDASVLEKLSKSQSKKPVKSSTAPSSCSISDPLVLTIEEARAALVILLNKLLIADAFVRPALPLLIEETLNRGFSAESIDFGSSVGLVNSILKSNGKGSEEFGLTTEEVGVIDCSFSAINGICALLDVNLSALVTVLDAVSALSCEAARADVAAFDMPVSGDGHSVKDEADVASGMKDLLFGSKFAGYVDSDVFSGIPIIHGSFRAAAKWLHALLRVELNSIVRIRTTSSVGSKKDEAMVERVLPLARSLFSVGKGCLGRAKLTIESIDGIELRSQVMEVFEKNCPGIEVLKNGYQLISLKATSDSYYTLVLHEIYDYLIKLRMIIAWEAALALLLFETLELDEKPQEGPLHIDELHDGIANLERKNEKKKKKKKVLGKGTSVIRQIIKDKIPESHNSAGILIEWAEKLSFFFDPKDLELDTLLAKVREIIESNEVRRLPKIPKGTREFGKEQMAVRERAFLIIVGVFKRHGGTALDTPVFELRETLMGKYGEDSKLIYDLADQGGEICSLRYDLTVPFARHLAMNNINALKRYQIAKVYRRDNPSKGRYREFYQCDFDIAGQYDFMEPDFEVLKILTELLDELNIGDYEIKLNHRKLLDGMLDICGVSPMKFRTVCSNIDKLDKLSFDQVKKELVEEKGLQIEIVDMIGSFVKKRGQPMEILSELKKEGSLFLGNCGSVSAMNDLGVLFDALEKSKCIHRIVFDLSLARGLDYYTGVVFEAVFKGGSTQVGSIAAGGRYDNLVGMFSGKQVPAVGVSLGIERVFAIMEEQIEKGAKQPIRATETQVLVVLLGKDLSLASELVSEVWNAGLKAEFAVTKKVVKQIDYAIHSGIPLMVIVGESELAQGVANIKEIATNTQVTVQREKVIEELQRRLNSLSQPVSDRYSVV